MPKIVIPYSKPIAFYPSFAKAFGSIEVALYLQQLMYWSDKTSRTDGYFYKTKEEIEDETTLTRRQQDNCRRRLEKNGIIETKLIKAHGAPTLHYKVNFRLVQNVLMEKYKTYESNGTKRTNPLTETTTDINITNRNIETASCLEAQDESRSGIEKPIDSRKSNGRQLTQHTLSLQDAPETPTSLEPIQRQGEDAGCANKSSSARNRGASKGRTWLTLYNDAWKARSGGDLPFTTIAKGFKKLITEHGEDKALELWSNFCKNAPVDQYHTPHSFLRAPLVWEKKAIAVTERF